MGAEVSLSVGNDDTGAIALGLAIDPQATHPRQNPVIPKQGLVAGKVLHAAGEGGHQLQVKVAARRYGFIDPDGNVLPSELVVAAQQHDEFLANAQGRRRQQHRSPPLHQAVEGARQLAFLLATVGVAGRASAAFQDQHIGF